MTSFYDYFYKKANKRLVQLFALYWKKANQIFVMIFKNRPKYTDKKANKDFLPKVAARAAVGQRPAAKNDAIWISQGLLARYAMKRCRTSQIEELLREEKTSF